MTGVRLRFAPSPTGHLHVGNARTALFNWLLARRLGGTYILRIEDTDTERSTLVSEQAIVEDLRWLGLTWDEGPDVGGAVGPYRQSERQAHYARALEALFAQRAAYYCFCSPELLEAEREAARAAGLPPRYSGRCRAIDPDVARRRVEGGEPAAVRFRIPADREVRFTDLVRGEVSFQTEVMGDPVIVRSDGRPAYNFAVVVDDAAMQITDVIRGEDHISNTPRQVLLYEALGLTPPRFAHLALVLGPDHAPLSKRHGATSVAEFRERGVLPEALAGYLARLGWTPGGDEELLDLAEMARRFDLATVGHSAAVFDEAKLAWMNRQYLRLAPPARLARLSLRYFASAGFLLHATEAALGYLESLMPMAVGSVDRLDEIPGRVAFLFSWDAARAADSVRVEPDGARAVTVFADEVAGLGPLEADTFRGAVGRVRARTSLKGRALLHPIRAALTGAESGPELDLAVPAMDRGALFGPTAGLAAVVSVAERARRVAQALEA